MNLRVVALLAVLPAVSAAQVVLNPTGGTGAGTGVRVVIGNTTQVQVFRNGAGQLYEPTFSPGATTDGFITNGAFVAVGNTVLGPHNLASFVGPGVTLVDWTPVSNTVTPQGSGGTATTVVRGVVGGRTYQLTTRWTYVHPNEFVTVEHTLVVPSGNTATVKLYHVADAYLDGDDRGRSFYSIGPPTVVGSYQDTGVPTDVVEGFRYRSGLAWTGYFAGFYSCLFDQNDCPMGHNNSVSSAATFTNYVEPAVVDNSFGIMWNLGTAPGTFTAASDLTFASFQPQLTARFGSTTLQLPAGTTTLTWTIDNVPTAAAQSGMGFTSALPAGLTIADATVTNTCGGTLTDGAGGAVGAGDTSIRLANGTLAGGTARCTLTVNVTASTPGVYTNRRGNVSAVTVLENQVSDSVLTVLATAPVVRLDLPGVINSTNAAAYPVSGTCQDVNGTVSLSVGSVSSTTTCAGGVFSKTVDVSGLADGATVAVTASQTNVGGTGTDTANTRKDTAAPAAPTIATPASGSTISDNTPTLTGTAEPGSWLRVTVMGAEVCEVPAVPGSGTWSCVTSTLADGTVTLVATATDPAGNAGPSSAPHTLIIDTAVPAAPVITTPTEGASVSSPTTLSGTGEAGATVSVLEGTGVLCTAVVAAGGAWSCTATLATGQHVVSARQQDAAGNTSGTSPNRTFTVASAPMVVLDAPGPISAANVFAYPVSGSCTTSAGTVTVTVGGIAATTACTNGRFSVTVNVSGVADGPSVTVVGSQTVGGTTSSDQRTTSKDTQGPGAPTITEPLDGQSVRTPTPLFTGTAEPGSTVTVFIDGVPVGTATADPNGAWTFTPQTPLADGTYVVTATAKDDAGNEGPASAPVRVTIDRSTPLAPVITAPVDGAMVDIAWSLDIVGQAEPGVLVTLYADGRLLDRVRADASGQFLLSLPPPPLPEGGHTLEADARDDAGNLSPKSQPVDIVVRRVEQRLAGRGLVGCTAAGAPALWLALAALLARRRGRAA